jgi:hypothetical protein
MNTLNTATIINNKVESLLPKLPEGLTSSQLYELPFDIVYNGTDYIVIILEKTATWSQGFTPGTIVLARRLNVTWDPWVTWFRRKDSDIFHHGHYYRNLEDAVADFENRW